MKDYFMGLRAGGDWFTSYSAIGSLTLNSSSSSVLGFSLGLYRMVHPIAGSIGRMVEFFDRSPCMKKIGLGSYNSFSAAIRTLPRSALDCESSALDRTLSTLDCKNRMQNSI
jgi:hypothetical protein